MKLSPNFTLEEATFSETAIRSGITNQPNTRTLSVIIATAIKMEAIRTLLGSPITITSWFRNLSVNRLIGSSDTSAHPEGFAVDFKCPKFGSPLDIIKKLSEAGLSFDQMIQEGATKENPNSGWVHISFDPRNRKQILTAVFKAGQKTTYINGLQYV